MADTLFADLIPEGATTSTNLFDDLVPAQPSTPQEAGRWTRQPENLKEWLQMTVGGVLHPIRQTETVIESVGSAIAGRPMQLMVRPSEVLETPALGKFGRLKEAETTAGKIAAGSANAAIGFAEFMTTPEGLLTLGLGKIKKEVANVVLADYAADMAIHAPGQMQDAITLAKEGRIQQAAEAATAGLGGTFLSASIVKHSTGKPTVREGEPIPGVDPVKVEEIATTAEQANASLTAAVVKDVVAEPQPKETDASRITETGELHANVPPQPREGEAQVPVGEGGEGVQPLQRVDPSQAPGDIVGPQGTARDKVIRFDSDSLKVGDQFEREGGQYRVTGVQEVQSEGRTQRTVTAIAEPGKEPTPTTPTPEPVPVPPEATVSGETKPPAGEAPPAGPPAFAETTPKEAVAPQSGESPRVEPAPERGVTALKNAMIEQDRAKMNLPAFEPVARQSYGEAWQQAMAQIDRDPLAQDKLIADLKVNPRAVKNAQEGALLHHAMVTLKNDFARTTAELTQAHAEGRMEDAASIQAHVDRLSDQVLELTDITKAAGTEAGRAFAARQQLIADDFSLVGLEVQKRAAVGGRKLTPTEKSDLAKLAADYEAKMQELQRKVLESSAGKAAAEKKYAPRILEALERFAKTMDEKAAAASQRLKEKFSRTSAGVDPTILSDLAIIGAAKITRGITDFAAWSDAMIKELGDRVTPELKAAWDASNKLLDEELKGMPTVAKAAATATKEKAKTINRVRGELNKLEADFKVQLEKDRAARGDFRQRAIRQALRVAATPRTIITSFDISAAGRQGAFLNAARPLQIGVPMLKEARTFLGKYGESKARELEAARENSPNAPLYRLADLYFAPLDLIRKGREEEYMPSWAENWPGIKGSQRAFVSMLNKQRQDIFDIYVADARASGKPLTPGEMKVLARFINIWSGRGSVLGFEKSADALAQILFSPRLLTSRFQTLMGPLHLIYGRGHTMRTRRIIAAEYLRALRGLGIFYMMVHMARPGATVEDDPKSSDFGKIKLGNTRIDPLAGLSQATVFAKRMTSGEFKNLQGEIHDLANPPGRKSGYGDVLGRFTRSKLAPLPGTLWSLKTEKDFKGDKFTWADVPKSLLMPMTPGDIIDVAKEHDIPEAQILWLLAALGMSVDVYKERKK